MAQNISQDPLNNPPGSLLTHQECLNKLYPREISSSRRSQFEQVLLGLLDHPVLKAEVQTVEDPPFVFRNSYSFGAAQYMRERLRLSFLGVTSEVFFEKYIPETTSISIKSAFWKMLKKEHKKYMKKEGDAPNIIFTIRPSALGKVIKLYNETIELNNREEIFGRPTKRIISSPRSSRPLGPIQLDYREHESIGDGTFIRIPILD